MKDSMKLKINDFGPVNDAEIDVGRITVIGGHNSTGKSTVSKLLFSFLKANSSKRQVLAIDTIHEQITLLIVKFIEYSRVDSNNFLSAASLLDNFDKLSQSNELESKLNIYDNLKDVYLNLDLKNGYKHDFDELFKTIDDLIRIVKEDDPSLYVSIIRKLLKSEFETYSGFAQFFGVLRDISYDFSIDLKNHDLDELDSFKYEGGFSINDVLYIDSASALDLSQFHGLQNTDHFKFLQNYLNFKFDDSNKVFDEKLYSKQIDLNKKIKNILKGEFRFQNNNLVFINDNGVETKMKDTASGLKQIGVIQLLLGHRRLNENSFLIIDEPEVNLHPELQIDFAEILVSLVDELNVRIYVNSHSPMFIEAISVFSQYYRLQDETIFYLTKNDNDDCNFVKIANDDMASVYKNLAEPYDILDKINAKLSYRK